MSRLTGTDAYGLMEAYNNVYAPQELTEEQVWKEVETWVNDLIEEGYDLSDYTWEEMYESYLSEAPVVPSMDQMVKKGLENQKFNQGFSKAATQLLGKPGQKPAPRPVTTAPTNRPVTTAPTNRPVTTAPTNRPVTTAPASPKPAAPAGGSALDRATASALTPTAFSPKPQSDVGAMITRSQARQAAQTPKPATPAPAARPMGGARERMLQRQSFDVFDVIKGHLIDEGYADTEESALVIMANMSEEWRESIVDNLLPSKQQIANRSSLATAKHKTSATASMERMNSRTSAPKPDMSTPKDREIGRRISQTPIGVRLTGPTGPLR